MNMSEICCPDFLRALNNYCIQYSSEIGSSENKFELFGYDMDEDYPPLNFCPSCGKKVVHFKPIRDEYDGHIIGIE